MVDSQNPRAQHECFTGEVVVLTLAALVALAAVSGTVLPWILQRVAWFDRSPGLGILAWTSGGVTFLLSTTLAGLVLVTSAESAADRVAHLLGTCLAAVRDHLGAVALEGVAAAAGVAVVGGTVLPVVAHLMGAFVRTAGRRRRHLAALAMVARQGADDTVVLDHPVAAAYCLPSSMVVVTTGALESLTGRELRATLAHERAHLRQRHHLLLTGASACARALPFVPLLRRAAAELPRLVELAADDAAALRCGRPELAAALRKLVAGACPDEALGAAGWTAAERVRRLAADRRALPRAATAGLAAVLTLLMCAPIGLTAAAVVHTTGADHCLLTEHQADQR
jgi:Zn-dependent protease with chaperone function